MDHISNQDIDNYFHLNKNNLENLLKKKYSPQYRRELKKQLLTEHHRNSFFTLLSIFISIIILLTLFLYLSNKMTWF